jgi:endonuclease/exonuclease/phosphatase family metal-dependent hydrolase
MRFLALFVILLYVMTACKPAGDATTGDPSTELRIATFNIAMGLAEEGQLTSALNSGDDERLQQVAGILRQVRPDIVLLNEVDYDPNTDAARLFNENYLAAGEGKQQPLHYPFHFRTAVNTGVDSGLDLDGDGETGGPGDAWGFGRFPGQYGMLVLSRFPLIRDRSRTFGQFRWSAMPGARRPLNSDSSPFHPDEVWRQLRLSSKNHWDVVADVNGRELHLLAHHPTPPVFDGPENRNGLRNFDEIRFWRDYTRPGDGDYIVDDDGNRGSIEPGASFVIAGDFNADPHDGDSVGNAIGQLLNAEWIDSSCVPVSRGAVEAAQAQGGVNAAQSGDPAADTADFSDRFTGNLRLDYLLPSHGLQINGCGVFWPAHGETGHDWVDVSDHRLVWLDIAL